MKELWQTTGDVDSLLEYLCRQGKVHRRKWGRRKLRLFACACCRDFWEALVDARSRNAIEVGERFADGLATNVDLSRAVDAARKAEQILLRGVFSSEEQTELFAHPSVAYIAAGAAVSAIDSGPLEVQVRLVLSSTGLAARAAVEGDEATPEGFQALRQLQRHQADLLRDIVPNPFHPVPALERAWLNWNQGLVVHMTQSIYQEGAFDQLPILADALEDAGCDRAAILSHCRSAGPHARGCWLVDALLSKG
jgi:hypothetical protein